MPPTGAVVSYSGATFLRFDADGLIAENWMPVSPALSLELRSSISCDKARSYRSTGVVRSPPRFAAIGPIGPAARDARGPVESGPLSWSSDPAADPVAVAVDDEPTAGTASVALEVPSLSVGNGDTASAVSVLDDPVGVDTKLPSKLPGAIVAKALCCAVVCTSKR